jgi:signal transduction histidine kinase
VRLTVADDGPGIPKAEIEVIEEGQETPLEHASGLGLWLVQHVVEQSGGDVEFEVEDGTRVHLTLPQPGE